MQTKLKGITNKLIAILEAQLSEDSILALQRFYKFVGAIGKYTAKRILPAMHFLKNRF